MKKRLSFLWLFALLFLAHSGYAKETKSSATLQGVSIVPGAQLTARDPLYPAGNQDLTWILSNRIFDQYAKASVALRVINPTTVVNDFTYTVNLDITTKDASGFAKNYQRELSVEYKGGSLVKAADKVFVLYEDAHEISVSISSVLANGLPVSTPQNIELEAVVEVDRFFDLPYAVPQALTVTKNNTTNSFDITWLADGLADEYDLEWLYINDYAKTGSKSAVSLSYDFDHNSTRVTVAENSYNVTNVFGKGYLLFRYRLAAFRDRDKSKRIVTPWSCNNQCAGMVNQYTNQFYYISGDDVHQGDELNWNYAVTYAEDGKKKEIVSYHDGLLKNRQEVTKVNTDTTIIVKETIYDAHGRPAIDVLPTPARTDILGYIRDYNRLSGTTPYTRDNFDVLSAPCLSSLPPMDSLQSGSSQYYSKSNPVQDGIKEFIPSAGGYPFTRTEYTPDNTGRVAVQTGIGNNLTKGTNHETRYLYGQPTQEELDRLFGMDVGYRDRYKKTLTIDANNQKSITYVDLSGKTIATCLSGNAPLGINGLPSNLGADSTTANILANKKRDLTLTSTFEYLCTTRGTHVFNYKLTDVLLDIATCLPSDICYSCSYELEIDVRDGCGELPDNSGAFEDFPIVMDIGTIGDLQCGDTNTIKQFTTFFEEGNYQIVKKLKLKEKGVEFYVNHFIENDTCIRRLKDFITEEIAKIDFTPCDPVDCETTCRVENPNATAKQIRECIVQCKNATECETQREILLMDMSPGGQYATYFDSLFIDPVIIDDDTNRYRVCMDTLITSVFCDSSVIINYSNAGLVYKNADGSISMVINEAGNLVRPNELNVKEFVANWTSSWAEALLPFHPEYGCLNQCDWLAQSDNYDLLVRSVDTYNEALELGLFNPLDFTNDFVPDNDMVSPISGLEKDPFFFGPGSAYRDSMETDLVNIDTLENEVVTIWHMAAFMGKCGKLVDSDAQQCIDEVRAQYLTAANGEKGYPSTIEACESDNIWRFFRSIYLGRKNYYREQYLGSYQCGSILVGEGDFENKIKRFSGFNEQLNQDSLFPPFDGYANSAQTDTAAISGYISSSCERQCEGYVPYWKQSLSGCFPSSTWLTADSVKFDKLMEVFTGICKMGCDPEHFFGASTTPPGSGGFVYEGQSFTNFGEAIQAIIGDSSVICNSSLVSSPEPFGYEPLSKTTAINPDTCACEKVLEARRQIGLTNSTETISDYMKRVYGAGVQDAQSVACLCDAAYFKGNNNIAWTNVQDVWGQAAADELEKVFRGEYYIAPVLGCNKCASCDEINAIYTDFKTRYPISFSENTPDTSVYYYQKMLVNAFNYGLGLDLTYGDYEEFINNCRQADTGIYCKADLQMASDLKILLNQIILRDSLTTGDCLCYKPYAPGAGSPYSYHSSIAKKLEPNFSFSNCDHLYKMDSISGESKLYGQIYSTSAGVNCTIEIEFVDKNKGYTFDRIASLTNLVYIPENLGANYAFEAVVIIDYKGSTVTTMVRGRTSCLVLANCGINVDDMTLCQYKAPPTTNPDPCRDQLITIAIHNAEERYRQYRDSLANFFGNAYTNACLNANEVFNMHYQLDEYHYTLYYYDQAGNLVRTVPPEGVVPIKDGATLSKIQVDRNSHKREIYTDHYLSTVYEYNSLNQLVRQRMPDHDGFNAWKPSSVAIALQNDTIEARVNDILFTGDSIGWMAVRDWEKHDKSRLYRTVDGGYTWNQYTDIGFGDFTNIALLSDQDTIKAFITSEKGIYLVRIQADTVWNVVNTTANEELNGVGVHGDTIVVVTKTGRVLISDNRGLDWYKSPTEIISPNKTVVDVVFHGNNGYATLSDGAFGTLFYTEDLGRTWKPGQLAYENLNRIALRGTQVDIVGSDATILSGTVGEFSFKERTSMAKFDFLDYRVISQHEAVAITETGKVMYSNEAGNTWTWQDITPGGLEDTIVALSPNTSNGIYVISSLGKIYYSTNAGSSWNSFEKPGALAKAKAIWAGNNIYFIGDDSGQLLRSTDGVNWINQNLSGNTKAITAISGVPSASTMFIAGNNNLFMKSPSGTSSWANASQSQPVIGSRPRFYFTGGSVGYLVSGASNVLVYNGISWSSKSTPQKYIIDIVRYNNKLYALTSRDLYECTTVFDTLTPINFFLAPIQSAIAVDKNDASTTYEQVVCAGIDGSVFVSDDKGKIWKSVVTNNNVDFYSAGIGNGAILLAGNSSSVFKTQGYADLVTNPWNQISVDNDISIKQMALFNDKAQLITTDGVIYNSIDLGNTWNKVFTSLNLVGIDVITDTNSVVAGNRGTILANYNAAGTTWGTQKTDGITDEITDFAFKGSSYACARNGNVFKLAADDYLWEPSSRVLPYLWLNGIAFSDENKGAAVGDSGRAIYTTDGAETWNLSATNLQGVNLNDIELETEGRGFAVGAKGEIWKTADFGVSYQPVMPSLVTDTLNAITFIGEKAYVVGDDGTILYNGNFKNFPDIWEKKTAPNGDSWPKSVYNESRDLLDVNFFDAMTGYAVGSKGTILQTTDGGNTWGMKYTPQPYDIHAFAMEPGKHQGVFGGLNVQPYRISYDLGFYSVKFWYDRVGRLVASQNSKQYAMIPPRCSFTRYDALNRIVRVGELSSYDDPTVEIINNPIFPDNWSTDQHEVMATYYDEPLPTASTLFGAEGQKELRNRVATSAYYNVYNPASTTLAGSYDFATHYSYDIHGNVKTILQQFKELTPLDQAKRIDYSYDLISGKVIQVSYQAGQKDAFYHRYSYDADNRITAVQTSRNGLMWESDATYSYYKHGPLARTEIGENKVQGTDYAYTLQGWLKAVNGEKLVSTNDIGEDGTSAIGTAASNGVAKDAFGYSLAYYNGDYVPIGGSTTKISTAPTAVKSASGDLFNGNIKQMLVALPNQNGSAMPLMAYSYSYDQLNRIRSMQAFAATSGNASDLTATQEYASSFNYDANGNITGLARNGIGTEDLKLDSLSYVYETYNGRKKNNRLLLVNEGFGTTATNDDVEDQGVYVQDEPATWNYKYDQIGNLVQDKADSIANISWYNSGKIKTITRVQGCTRPDLEFQYDALGNRVAKIVKFKVDGSPGNELNWVYTYYVRDAQGNPMSVYERTLQREKFNYRDNLFLKEQDIYGSSRLGLRQTDGGETILQTARFDSTDQGQDGRLGKIYTLDYTPVRTFNDSVFTSTAGLKRYELTNHLGNVMAVVSDRKLITSALATTTLIPDIYTANDYYPFGMQMPGRQFSSSSYRYGFNGKENDNEVMGTGNWQDYGARMYNPRLGRFPNPDPKAKLYPMLSTYQFASNTPIQAIDLDGKEAFIVHGTTQTETGVHITPEAKKELMRITGNTKIDDKFRWNAPLYNNAMMRNISANQLVKHIVKTRMAMIKNGDITEDEAVSLIGYSHGGNVSIQAARKLGKMGVKVNLVTLSTPAYNTSGNDAYGGGFDSEDPRGAAKGINAHYQVVHGKDDVVNIAGGTEKYNNGTTKNFVITNGQIPFNNGIDAHTKFPGSEKLDDVLKNVPAMPKAPAPKLPDTVGKP